MILYNVNRNKLKYVCYDDSKNDEISKLFEWDH